MGYYVGNLSDTLTLWEQLVPGMVNLWDRESQSVDNVTHYNKC